MRPSGTLIEPAAAMPAMSGVDGASAVIVVTTGVLPAICTVPFWSTAIQYPGAFASEYKTAEPVALSWTRNGVGKPPLEPGSLYPDTHTLPDGSTARVAEPARASASTKVAHTRAAPSGRS